MKVLTQVRYRFLPSSPREELMVVVGGVVQFDKSASQTLSSQLKTKCSAKGHLSTYRLCDEVCHSVPFHLAPG